MDYKTYKIEEIQEKVLEYFDNDELATDVWIKKYSLKNKKGEILEKTPIDTHKRMSKEFARIEENYNMQSLEFDVENLSEYGRKRKKLTEEKIFSYFDKFKYIVPQGSVMASLGNEFNYSSLSNCIVIPKIYDSYGGIMFADQQLTQLFKRRCGVGLDISTLRPKDSITNNSAGTSTGAISFMERFSNTTREVAQSGRRGALMISIDVRHPDIEDFITIKEDLKKVTGANISVKLSDEFMEAVKNEKKFTLKFPIDSKFPLIEKEIEAKDLWEKISTAARNSAEPGLIFWDRQHWYSTSSIYPDYENVGTNPCVIGDTLILTNIGWIRMKNLEKYKKNIKIITRDKENNLCNSDLIKIIKTENEELFKICIENGDYLITNSKHKFYGQNFEELGLDKLKDNYILSGNGTFKVIDVIKLDRKEDVYDITATPNYNFFCILNKEEFIMEDDIDINDNIKFKYFDVVNTDKGQKFAYQLEENDEIL